MGGFIGQTDNLARTANTGVRSADDVISNSRSWLGLGGIQTDEIAKDVAALAVTDPKAAADLLEGVKGRLSVSQRQALTADLGEAMASQQKKLAEGNLPAGMSKGQRDLALDLTQIALDVVGLADPTPVSDGLNGVISLFRGDFLGAGISAVSMVPYIGDAAKLGKLGSWGKTVANAAELVAKSGADSAIGRQMLPVLRQIGAAIDAIPGKVLDSLPASARRQLGDIAATIDGALAKVDGKFGLSRLDHPRTTPTGEIGGKPSGTRKVNEPNAGIEQKRGLARENESADILAREGFQVHQLKDGELSPADMQARRLNPSKNPDYMIEGNVFDGYAPRVGSPLSARDGIADKVGKGQTERVVVNLGDADITRAQLEDALRQKPVEGLIEAIVIGKDGQVGRINLGG